LTAERFIDNPFTSDGSKLYATGDRACFRPDGNIDFLGRQDNQIKLRGFRIEMGEIEHALGQHPAIGAHIVTLRQASDGDKMLVAYLIAKTTQPPQSELTHHLQRWLPSYMIPRHFVWLDALPLTRNGKVDRQALPQPEQTRPDLASEFVAPRTPLEETLASWWSELLSLTQIGIYDNFFSLGGHSLLTIRLLAKIRARFKLKISLIDFYAQPTLAHLAHLCTTSNEIADATIISPVSRDQQLPLSFAQQRLWFLDQFSQGGTSYNIPLALQLQGDLVVTALEQSLTSLLKRHEILRTTYHQQNDTLFINIHPFTAYHLPILPISEEMIQPYIVKEAQTAFDLQKQVTRTALLRVTPSRHILLINIHHIALDGISFNLIANELAALYNSIVRESPRNLPPQPIQYADYALWQRNWLQGDNWQRLLDYWHTKLANAPATLALPTDFPYPAQQRFQGRKLSVELTDGLVEKLRAVCQTQSVTMYTLLLATYQWLLYRYTKETIIPVGTPYAGREREELADLIGFFINTLVIATEFTAVETFQALLARVHDTVLEAIDHADMPFDQLVTTLNKQRTHNRSPLFQTFFTAQSSLRTTVTFDNLTTQRLNTEPDTAKFELLLNASELTDRLALSFEYNIDLFSAETIQTFADHYATLLHALCDNITISLHTPLLLLTDKEHATMAVLQTQFTAMPTLKRAVIAPLYDAPQGVKMGAWVMGKLPAATPQSVTLIPVDHLPTKPNGEIDFGRLPLPQPPAATPPPTQSRAALLAAKRAKLAARRKKLSPRQQQQLSQLLQKKQQPTTQHKASPQSRPSQLPLSFIQEQLWFIDQLTPHSNAYNMPFRIKFLDPIAADLLQQALTLMVARHEILRTHFERVQGRPIQVIDPPQPFVLTVKQVDNEAELQQLISADANQPFDLTHSPLLRATLLLYSAESILLLTFQHIIFDGWSWMIFLQEIITLYAGLAAGKAQPLLPPVTLQYADFSLWQRAQASQDSWQQQLAYWRNQLANAPTQLALPFDSPHPAQPRMTSGRHTLEFDAATLETLLTLSKNGNVTLYMLLVALYSLLLHQYSQQDDFLVGTILSNRNAQTEQTLGLFANTLPLRITKTGDPTFQQFLQAIRQTILDSLSNQAIPFTQIVSTINPPRINTQHPMLQAFMVVQPSASNTPTADNPIPLPIRMQQWGKIGDTARYDLLFSVTHSPKHLRVGIIYNADVFRPHTIAHMAEHFNYLVTTCDLKMRLSQFKRPPTSQRSPAFDQRNLLIHSEKSTNQPFVAPRTEIEHTITKIWQTVLGISPISMTATFFELGGTSLLAVQMVDKLQAALKQPVPVALLFQHNTIEKLGAACLLQIPQVRE
ncbi:MAG TPA: hypothetical protein ENJ56_00995, partial [Anaerolineae bacterium]|nr:hypothetical protein [Anaerolineae bacterium]